jgi:hypothetical protein
LGLPIFSQFHKGIAAPGEAVDRREGTMMHRLIRSATTVALLVGYLTVCTLSARADTPVTTPYDDGYYKGTQTTATTSYVSGNATVTETKDSISAEHRDCDGKLSTHKKTTTTRVFTDRTTGLKTREQTTTHIVETGPDGSRTHDSEETKEYDALGGYKTTVTFTDDARKPDGTSAHLTKMTSTGSYDASDKETGGDFTLTKDGVRFHSAYDPATGSYKSDAGEPAPAPKTPMIPPKNPTACPPPALTFRIGTNFPTEDTLRSGRYNVAVGYAFSSPPSGPELGLEAGMRHFGTAGLSVNVSQLDFSISTAAHPGPFIGLNMGVAQTKVGFASSSQSNTGLAGNVFAGYMAPGGIGLDVEWNAISPSVGSIKSTGVGVNLIYRPSWFLKH